MKAKANKFWSGEDHEKIKWESDEDQGRMREGLREIQTTTTWGSANDHLWIKWLSLEDQAKITGGSGEVLEGSINDHVRIK